MGNKGIGAFIVGGLVGAGIALLYAPRPGVETRAMVSDKVNDTWGEAQEFGAQASANVQQFYQDATVKGQEVIGTVSNKSQEIYGTASGRVQEVAGNVKPVFTEKNDELRDKIEAARARIASQVAKNAGDAPEAEEVPAVAAVAEETGAVPAAVAEAVKEAAENAQNK